MLLTKSVVSISPNSQSIASKIILIVTATEPKKSNSSDALSAKTSNIQAKSIMPVGKVANSDSQNIKSNAPNTSFIVAESIDNAVHIYSGKNLNFYRF